jgi:glucose-6-phosphate 1-dehydrogenase
VVSELAEHGLSDGARVVVEKPFGRDLASARELNRTIAGAFAEHQVFRIDHYLGKETVENLLTFRFANSLFEPLWNRDRIASVQVTLAESFGVEGRGAFYDSVGAVRDVVQNHLLQLVAMLAMEPPVGDSADRLRDEKVKVLRAVRPLGAGDVV